MTQPALIVFNAGSTSLKFGVYPLAHPLQPLCRGQIQAMRTSPHLRIHQPGAAPSDHPIDHDAPLDHPQAIDLIIDWAQTHLDIALTAAGHRVVLGGPRYEAPIRITDAILNDLATLAPIEPGHQSINLACIRAAIARLPNAPHIACFDSSFHRTMPAVAQHYPLPAALQTPERRHWGYHGLSYEYIATRLAVIAPTRSRVIIAHLGGGASLCAVRDGHSVETSMGLSSLSGLPMETRAGDLPPELILHLLRDGRHTIDQLETLLYHHAGLTALAHGPADMPSLERSTSPDAVIALAHFVHAILKFIGAYTAILGGLDALVFTGGIGEHAAGLRASICHRLAWLGLTLDADANANHAQRITTPTSRVAGYVIPTDEEQIIATHTLSLLERAPPA